MPDASSKLKVSGKQSGSSLAQIVAGMDGAGDPTKYLDGACALSTPAGGSGLVLVETGTVTGAVGFIDLALPAEYGKFRLEIWNLKFSDTDYFAATFSFDDGETYLNDNVNHDSYYGIGAINSTPLVGVQPGDSVMFDVVRIHSSSILPMLANIDIFPGSSSFLASALAKFCSIYSSHDIATWADIWCYVNPDATVAPTPARATNFRITPDGNGDVDPPTSGETIVSGSWALFGLPT